MCVIDGWIGFDDDDDDDLIDWWMMMMISVTLVARCRVVNTARRTRAMRKQPNTACVCQTTGRSREERAQVKL
jgi:hypothetical protein